MPLGNEFMAWAIEEGEMSQHSEFDGGDGRGLSDRDGAGHWG